MKKQNKTFTKILSAALAAGVLAACAPGMNLMSPQAPMFQNRALMQYQSMSASSQKVFNTQQAPREIPNQAIVKVRNPQAFIQSLSRVSARVVDSFDLDTPVFLVEAQGRSTRDLVQQFSQDPNVEFAQPNFHISLASQLRPAMPQMRPMTAMQAAGMRVAEPNDPLFGQQWHLKHVNALDAWNVNQGNDDFLVSVVDTGVDYNHPDLKGRVLKGKDYTKESDGTDPIDGFGHGTHVAGIINAITNNGQGVAGVAPNVKVLAVKVLSANGGGSLFAIAGGIKHSVDMGAKIVNLSLGGPAVTDLISSAVGWWATSKKGALLIAAAGNSSSAVGTPARIDDYYMAVGATDEADKLAKFSCFGKELSVTAPGTNIMATTPTYKVPLNDYGYPMNYAALQGTSMATPLVAGIAALVWSQHPEWNYKQVRAHLEKTSVDLGPKGKDNTFGFGRVDAAAALR